MKRNKLNAESPAKCVVQKYARDSKWGVRLTRRDFIKYSSGAIACTYLGALGTGCGGDGGDATNTGALEWPIEVGVFTTVQRQILPAAIPDGTPEINPSDLALYSEYGYTDWESGPGLPCTLRLELMASGYVAASNAGRLLSFFTMTDIHIADKESPAQPLYIGWSSVYGPSSAGMSSAYSPVLLASTQVLDAAIQTINALHRESPFDFGVS